LTRALTIMALTGLLVVGAAAASILAGVGIWAPGPASTAEQGPVTNWENKTDKLAVVRVAPAPVVLPQALASVNDSMRLAYASTTPDTDEPNIATRPATGLVPMAPPKPKLAAKPAPQKSYALLSDAQIAGIKDRLKLSSDQQPYWPAVESALRAVAKKIHETRQANPHATGAPIDPDCAEVEQLKSAAMPLLFQLREDQKNEVRTLARLIGLEQVASQI
jgi:ABC-type transporter Mla MlaB component